jgi:dihydrofolate reductase
MRKVVAGLFISLDGVVESPDKWQEHFDDDMLAALEAHIANTDAILLGRITYEEWMPYWTTATQDLSFADHINQNPKYIASTTLDKVEWGQWDNATLLKGNIIEAINKLKQQPGKNIAVEGSPTLARFLLENNVLDELQLYIHPVIAGSGKRFFRDGSDLKRLKLVSSKPTRTDNLIVTYQVRK